MATVHRAMEQDPESEGRRLRHKRPAAAAAEDVAESAKMKKGTKSRKDISKDYRERVKENPELLKAHREAEEEKNGSREYYGRRSEEAVQRNRELERERQRQYRERCKVRQESHPKAPKTRKTRDEDRKRWREEKRLQRQNMSRADRRKLLRKSAGERHTQ